MSFLSNLKKVVKNWLVPPGYIVAFAKMTNHNPAGVSRTPEEKKLLGESKKLKDIHKGKRCFILGAGSSIKDQDIRKLAGEYVISVSNTYVHPDFSHIKPKYHVLPYILAGHGSIYEESRFVSWLAEMDEKTLQAEMLFDIGDRQLIEKNGLFRNRKIHWVNYVKKDSRPVDPIDLAQVPNIWSVSEIAITTAIYLGFDKIYLLGFDHDWFNGPLVYFFDHHKEHKLKPNAESLSFADAEFQMRRHAEMFKKYKELFLIKRNIFNANSNPNHYLDVFPKVDFNSLFPQL
jgi:hypothetical protein